MDYSISETIPEEIYVAPLAPPPIVVFDFQVHAHSIHNYLESSLCIEDYDREEINNIISACWAIRLNRGPDMIQPFDFTGIVVDDYKDELPLEDQSSSGKGYWRHIVAHECGLQEYKIGRSQHTELFNEVKRLGYAYVGAPRSTFFYSKKQFMEADDIAGKLARLKREAKPESIAYDRHMLLSTVDGDWQGLVSDNFNILWCNTGPWLPRLRDEKAVCDYYLRKNNVEITDATQCYEIKASQGDLGDGLVAGSPIRLFDLINEDHVYNFSEPESINLYNILNSTQISNNSAHLVNAQKYLDALGLVPPLKGYNDPKEVEYFLEKANIDRDKFYNPPIRGRFKSVCGELKPDEIYSQLCAELAKKDQNEKISIDNAKLKLESCDRKDTECIRFYKTIIKNLKKSRENIAVEVKALVREFERAKSLDKE